MIGVLRLSLGFRQARSLKEKRHVLRSVEQKLRNIGCSVAECGFQDNPKRAVIGVTYVSNSPAVVEKTLDDAKRMWDEEVEVFQADRDVFDYSEMEEQPAPWTEEDEDKYGGQE